MHAVKAAAEEVVAEAVAAVCDAMVETAEFCAQEVSCQCEHVKEVSRQRTLGRLAGVVDADALRVVDAATPRVVVAAAPGVVDAAATAGPYRVQNPTSTLLHEAAVAAFSLSKYE